MKPRYNDPQYEDIPGIMMNLIFPAKSYIEMYGTELWYNDLQYDKLPYNDIDNDLADQT